MMMILLTLERLILYNNKYIMRPFVFLIYYLCFYILICFNRIMMLQQASIGDEIPDSLMNEMDFES